MLYLRLSVFLSLTMDFITCQRLGAGNCPNLLVKKDFDANQYVGTWHEIEKIPVKLEENLKCSSVNYTLERGYLLIVGRGMHRDGTEEHFSGKMAAPDKNVPAKLIVTFDEQRFGVNYWILDTDYKAYAITYSCISMFRIIHLEYLWILSRKQSLEANTFEEIYKWLDGNQVDRKLLQKTDQNCK